MVKGMCVRRGFALGLVLAILFAFSIPALADNGYDITGTVYGNGTVLVNGTAFAGTALDVTGEAVFIFVPGAANTVKEFSVNGTSYPVTDNQATVPAAGGDMEFEAVFSAEYADTDVTRMVGPWLIENGVDTSDGSNMRVTDSQNGVTIYRNLAKANLSGDAVDAKGYRSNDLNAERLHVKGDISRGAFVKAGLGRTYRPYLYVYFEGEEGTEKWPKLYYELKNGKLPDGYQGNGVLLNSESNWNTPMTTLDPGEAQGCTTKTDGKDRVVANTVTALDCGGVIKVDALYRWYKDNGSDAFEPMTNKKAYAVMDYFQLVGGGGPDLYIKGASFLETVPYHGVKAAIGEGEIALSSDSLNFGTDNGQILLKDGSVAAVEHYQDATVTLRAPEDHLIRSVTWTPEGGTPVAIEEGLGKSVCEFTLESVDGVGTISAQYDAGEFYDITLSITGGTAAVTYGGATYTENAVIKTVGADAALVIEAGKGYEFASITYDGSPVAITNSKAMSITALNKAAALTIVMKEATIGGRAFYVAPDGSDSAAGTLDAPFATPEAAMAEIRRLKAADLLEPGPVYVYFRGGSYDRRTPFTLTAEDSGTEESPIVFASYPGEKALFNGGKKLDASKAQKVTDQEILDRILDPFARTRLMQIDLGEQGVDGFYGLANWSYDTPYLIDFYVNGSAMNLARWPNDEEGSAFIKITSVEGTDASQPFTLGFEDPAGRTARWHADSLKNLAIKGGLANEYTIVSNRVASVDSQNNKLTTVSGSVVYPTTQWGKFYFYNLLDEIDVPGEYFIDNETKMLYFYPTTDDLENADLFVSQHEDAMFKINGAAYITLQDLAFSYSKRTPVVVDASHVTLDGCTISHTGVHGAALSGTDITVENCHIFDIACDGINLSGSATNRETLASDNNKIVNNRIHSVSRVSQSNSYAVQVVNSSVGLEIKNNEIYDCRGIAIRLWKANNTLIQDNEIYNALQYTSDNGAIYWGRDLTTLGNQVIHNYIHDLGNSYGGYGFQGIFVDDCGSGPYMADNILYRCGSMGYKTNCGNYGHLENNLFIDTEKAVWFQRVPQARYLLYGMDKWKDASDQWGPWGYSEGKKYVQNENWKEYYIDTQWAPFFTDFSIDLYNQIKDLDKKEDADELWAFATKNAPADTNYFGNNIMIGAPYDNSAAITGENYTAGLNDTSKAMFVDYGSDFALTGEGLAKVRKSVPDFEPVTMDGIGLLTEVGGTAPAVLQPTVINDGTNLLCAYQFSDADGDREGAAEINWYVSDTENGTYTMISGRHDKTLPLDSSLTGKYICCEVTPFDENGLHGKTVRTQAVKAEEAETVPEAVGQAVSWAEELLNTVPTGTGFGTVSEQAYRELKQVVDAVAEPTLEALLEIEAAIDSFQNAVNQEVPSAVASGTTLPIYDFMTSKTFTLDQNTTGVTLTLPRGKELPAITVNGFIMVDGVKQPAVLTVPAKTKLAGIGRVTMNLFGDSETPSVSVDGEKVTSVKLTADRESATKPMELIIQNGWSKVASCVTEGKLLTISGSTLQSRGYAREKAGSKDLKLTTTALGEFVLYSTAQTPSQSPVVTPATPSYQGGGGVSTGVSGNILGIGATDQPGSDPSVRFTDIVGHWAENDINNMAKRGIVSGVTETTFEPEREITRAEFAALVARALQLTAANGNDFQDVDSGSWYADEVAAASAAGLISGYDGYFRPDETITREEMAVIIVKACQFGGGETATGQIDRFIDQDQISQWALTFADQAVSTGLISGMTADTFAPQDNATRAQVTSLLKRLLDK